jgi:ankyrin repeat protein
MNGHWEKELKDAILNNRPNQIHHMKLIINQGADMDWTIPGGMGRTLLFMGIIHERFDAVKCLLEAGADPNISDEFGETPLHRAKTSGLKKFDLYDSKMQFCASSFRKIRFRHV